ncbi:hypothetical protein L1887_58337 [Cichorium endivia]|nr:hypothetical protein L1887_58337 [Cichorium endivia]
MLLEQWLSDLAYIKFPHELYRAGDSIGTRPYASEIEEMLEIGGGISASAVFCVGEVPTVCFIDSQTLQLPRQKRVEQICQRVWNQNLASVVLVLDPDGLVAYSVNDREAEPEVLSREAVVAQGYWSAYEVQSGFIKDRLSHWFLPEERVDQRLLANLRQVVKQLAKEGLGSSQAEALMAQVIFLCYLEQRGIVGEGYRATHNLERLEDYVAKSDGEGVDSLLRQLKFDFNGDFLSSRDGGAPDWVVLNEQCFRCIYETLLKDRQGALGAYYTPRHLASLVTEQAFESFDNPAGCTVYDGACGSGKRKFDILLSNPPWRESDNSEKPVWEEWCRKHVPPYPVGRRQIAAGYAFKATSCVKVNSVIVLIMPLNLVIGASDQSGDFRRRWLEDVRIERIINFADVRRLLFPAAKHPCAVVRARPRSFEDEIISLGSEYVEYWAPKTDVTLALGRLALHEADKKIISAKEIYQDNYLLISSYWGEKRDQKLLRRLQRFGSVKETMESRESPWLSGKGFHAANHSNRDRELGVLADLSLMPADRLPRVYPIVSADAQLARLADFYPIVASPGGKNAKLYSGPRVIFPDGLSESYVIRAIYSEVPFAFTSSIGAIGGASVDANLLKFLMIYLRSPIATYMLIMTGYSVIGERPRVAIDDVERFPFCSPEAHKKPELAKEIIFKSCQLLDKISAESELHQLALWRSRSRGAGELTVEAVIDGAKGFFGAVRVSVGESSTGGLNVADSAYQRLIGDLYAGLEANHSVESEGKLFNVPNILVAAGEAFYFVKPLRRRFWLARTALADADLIVQTIPDVLVYMSDTWSSLLQTSPSAISFEKDEPTLTDNLCEALSDEDRRFDWGMDCDFQAETWELRRAANGDVSRIARADIRVILGAPAPNGDVAVSPSMMGGQLFRFYVLSESVVAGWWRFTNA